MLTLNSGRVLNLSSCSAISRTGMRCAYMPGADATVAAACYSTGAGSTVTTPGRASGGGSCPVLTGRADRWGAGSSRPGPAEPGVCDVALGLDAKRADAMDSPSHWSATTRIPVPVPVAPAVEILWRSCV